MKMTTFEIWHLRTSELFLLKEYSYTDRALSCWLNNRKNYIKVAEVEARDLDEVWDITQNRGDSWAKKSAVKWSKSHKLESTSVGDVIVHNGKAWLYLWEGFME